MEISENKGMYRLVGRLDEYADFSSLLTAAAPVRLDLGGVTAINSIGIRNFLAFTLKWAPKRIEFHNCLPDFITNLNVIPQILGPSCDVTQIQSFYVPFACDACKRISNALFLMADVAKKGESGMRRAGKACEKCGEPMRFDIDPSEYFVFLSQLAKPPGKV